MERSDIASGLRGGVLRRTLIPGAPLPTTAALAVWCGVSEATVRRAENVLLAEGLVERVYRRGLFVKEAEPVLVLHRVLDALDGADQPDPHDVRKLVDMALELWRSRSEPFLIEETTALPLMVNPEQAPFGVHEPTADCAGLGIEPQRGASRWPKT